MKKRLLFLSLIIITVLVTALAGCSIFGDKDKTTKDDTDRYVTLTFDSQGGSVVESRRGLPNNLVGEITPPTKEGVTFLGWYKDKEGSKKADIKYFPKKDTTVYAIWGAATYSVTLYGNGGSGTQINSVNFEEDIILPTDWIKDGYSFGGWYKDASLIGEPVIEAKKVRSNLEYHAKWIPNVYTIKFETNGGSVVLPLEAEYMSSIKLPIPSKKGFFFDGWCIDQNLKTKVKYSVMPMGNQTLYARWVNSYTVKYMDKDKLLYEENLTNTTFKPIKPINTSFNKPDEFFLGWYLDKGLTQKAPDTIDVVEEEIVLYSMWKGRSFLPYLDIFNSQEGTTIKRPIKLADREMFIALVDYIIFTGKQDLTYFEFEYLTTLQAKDELYKALQYTTNQSLSLGVYKETINLHNEDVLTGKFGLSMLKTNKDSTEQKLTNYKTIKGRVNPEKYKNILIEDNIETQRSETFDNFKYKTAYKEELEVETSDQLFYALQHGLLPKIKPNSIALSMMNKAKAILRRIITDDMSDFDKMYAIYKYLVENVAYDHIGYCLTVPKPKLGRIDPNYMGPDDPFYSYKVDNIGNTYDSWHIEGVLNNKVAVCDGIAKTVVLMARIEGIPCIRIVGSGHAWNKVYIDINNDNIKEWYDFDATWGNTGITIKDGKIGIPSSAERAEMAVFYNFLFDDNYNVGKDRIATNNLSIKAETPINIFKCLFFEFNNEKYDLYIENELEIDALARYVHSQINKPDFNISRTYTINILQNENKDIESFVTYFEKYITIENDKEHTDNDVAVNSILKYKGGNIPGMVVISFTTKNTLNLK